MKIMIFGASGYIAGFVTRQLASLGHSLVLVARQVPDAAKTTPDSSWIECAHTEQVRQLISDVRPDVVLNMANYYAKSESPSDVVKFAEVNSALVTELAFGCCQSGAALFHVGSAWQATSFQEDDPSLGSVYALHKGLAVKIIEWFQASHQLDALILNLYDTYGPEDPRGKIVQFLINQVGATEPLELSGGEQILELVHVQDVAGAVAAGVEFIADSLATTGRLDATIPFWCYPECATTLRELVAAIDENAPKPISVRWGARPYRVGEKFDREIAGKPLIPGWKQEISLRDGIMHLLATA